MVWQCICGMLFNVWFLSQDIFFGLFFLTAFCHIEVHVGFSLLLPFLYLYCIPLVRFTSTECLTSTGLWKSCMLLKLNVVVIMQFLWLVLCSALCHYIDAKSCVILGPHKSQVHCHQYWNLFQAVILPNAMCQYQGLKEGQYLYTVGFCFILCAIIASS